MELENIIKLIDAGYTKEEILSLQNPEQPAEADPEPEQPAGTPAASQPAEQSPPAGYDQVLEAINKLTSAIVTRNLNTTIAESTAEQTTQDILAKVIAPPKPKKGK